MAEISKGDIFYKAYLNLESSRIERSTLEIEEWHVTKIDKNGIYLTQKVDRITWGKRSTKQGDFGFLNGIHSVYKDALDRDNDLISEGYFKTKVGAFRSIKPVLEKKYKELQRLLNRVNKSIEKSKVK